MEVYKIHYANVFDLILHVISLMPLSPFYTLNRYKDFVYFYEAMSDSITLHYAKANIEPAIYVFDTSKLELKKQNALPKFVEHGCYIVIFKKIEEDSLLSETLEES